MAIELRRTGGIQEEDVWQAADALLLAGERPTIERVRRHLGRGSPNTVSPCLDRWFSTLGTRLQDPKAFSPAAGVPEPVQQAAKHFWEVASATARSQVDQQYQQRQAALDEQHAETERQRQALVEREAGLTRAIDEAVQRAQAATELASRLTTALAEREVELASARTQLAEERGKRAELDRRFEADRQAFDAERLAINERAEAERRRAAQEIDRSRELAKEVSGQLSRAEKALVVAREQHAAAIAALRVEASAVREQLDATATKLALAEARNESAEAERQRARERADTLLARVDALQEQLQLALRDLRERDDARTALIKSIAFPASGRKRPPKSS